MEWYLDSMVTWMGTIAYKIGLLGLSSRQKKIQVNKSFVF